MAGKRNRIVELQEYISSLGISVNIGKNKARGHKGIFMHRFNDYRIDVSKNLNEDSVIQVILHEFAHYIHYIYDKTLKNLDFIFDEQNNDIKEELIKITVREVPKDFAKALYEKKELLNSELKDLISKIKEICPEFKLSQGIRSIEKSLACPLNYLLKYDRVKYFNKLYSIDKLNEYNLSEEEKLYILIKSKQRDIKRINSRINRLNKYYNNPAELFARFIESYYTDPIMTKKIAPVACKKIETKNIPYLEKLDRIFCAKE